MFGDDLIDLHAGANALTLERVRCVGFDTGAGGSSAFYAGTGVALRVRDSRIEGGYGRSPAFGHLIDLRTNAALLRFERCEISCLTLEPARLRSPAIVFAECRFSQLLDGRPVGESPRVAEMFERRRFDDPAPAGFEPPERDLDELFPDCRKRVVR